MSKSLRRVIQEEIVKPPELTPRQKVGKYIIVNERPEGMSFEEYKAIRKQQTKLIKSCKIKQRRR